MDRVLRCCVDNLLISVTVCFIVGAGVAYTFSSPLSQWPVAAISGPVLLMLGASALVLKSSLRLLTMLPFFLLVGFLHTHLALQPESDPGHVASLVTEKSKVTLIGRILTLVEYDGDKTRFELATESILIHEPSMTSVFQPVRGTVQITVQDALGSHFVPGAKIMVIAMLAPIRDYQTPGALPYRLQMASKSIRCSGWVHSAQEILLVYDPSPSLGQRLRFLPEQVRQQVTLFLNQRFDPTITGIYQALLIGSARNISPEMIEMFKENGCMHVLSISGLHLSLLGLFAVTVFTFLLKRSQWLLLHAHVPTLALVLTAPLLLLYTFIAGMNIPAFRSLVTALLVLFAVVLRRQRSLIHLIAATALLVLAVSPLALFTASFQLSFAAVLAINCIYPRLPLVVDRPDAKASPGLIMKGVWTLQSMFYVSLAATAGTLPFILYHFNRFSLIGPVMNLIIEPLLCLWALPCGLLGIPLIWLSPDLAEWIFKFGSTGIWLTVWFAEAMVGFPYASIWTITPTLLEIAVFFIILWILLQERRTARGVWLALMLAVGLLGSFTFSLWIPWHRKELIVSYLDVGQGTSTLLQLPGGKNILVDGGGSQSEQFNPGANIIGPFLWRQRIWRLDDLIITHPHKDHYNGLPFVYARFQPQRLIVNGDNGDEPAYLAFLEKAHAKKTPIICAKAGDKLLQQEGLLLECLGMNGLLQDSSSWSTNHRSLVLRLQFGKRSFLFPGDIGVESEKLLVRNGGGLNSDVLLAPHHGSLTSSSPAFIEAVSPAMIVVSAGTARQDSLPAPAHRRQWGQKGIQVLVTSRQGTVTCCTDGTMLQADTFTGDKYHWQAKGRMVLREKGGLNSQGL